MWCITKSRNQISVNPAIATMKSFIRKVVFIFWILSSRSQSFGLSKCPENKPGHYVSGQVDCSAPIWTYGRYLHEIKFPSWVGEMFYRIEKRAVDVSFCRPGTCFSFSKQTCIPAEEWKNECKFY